MIRLNACYSMKVPGAEQYSSNQASASVEIELTECDGPQIQAKLAELWTVVRSAVENQLANGSQPPRAKAPGNDATASQGGNGHSGSVPQNGSNRRASSGAAISEKQEKFIRGLVGELRALGMDFGVVENLCDRLFSRRLTDLDRAQASIVIGHLAEIKAGKLTVQQLQTA